MRNLKKLLWSALGIVLSYVIVSGITGAFVCAAYVLFAALENHPLQISQGLIFGQTVLIVFCIAVVWESGLLVDQLLNKFVLAGPRPISAKAGKN